MVKRLLLILCTVFFFIGQTDAQCPTILDYNSVASLTPTFKSCNGGTYAMFIQSPSNFPAYTINWGDASPNATGASYAQNTPIPHTYAAGINTFVITLTIPLSACTMTMPVVMEQAAIATISITSIGATQCAPKTFTFTNITVNQTPSTTYTWSWGDGSPNTLFNSANNQTVVTHTYQKNTVQNCGTTVFLYANNVCNFVASFDQKGPFQIFDTDVAAVTPDAVTKCWPDNSFTFGNTTLRQCQLQGNNGQRYEYWNLGDHWSLGYDSIINWKPWPPTTPVTVSYPAIGSYTVMLLDSNACGIDPVVQTVNIVNPPTAGIIAPGGLICQNTNVTFTNTSAPGYTYKWNFGTNPAFVNLGNGNKSITYTAPGTYTVKLVALVNGANSFCSDTATAVVNVLAAPVADFSLSPSTGCSTITGVTFTNSSTSATLSTWNLGNGNTFSGLTPPPQTYTQVGVSTISLVVTGSTTCTHTKTLSVIVYPTPVPSFPVFANCVNAVSNFSSTSTVTGTSAINSYTWNFGDNTPKSNLQNPSHTYTLASTYPVKLIVANAHCRDSITQNILINLRPSPNFVFTPTISCPPFVSMFSNTTTNGVNYLWRFGTAPTATSNLASPTFTYLNSTQNIQNYTVTLVSSTGAGCPDSIKKVIAVYPRPVASFTTSSNAGCSPIAVNFTNTTLGAISYSWDYGDGGSSTQTNTAHTYTNTTLSFLTRTVVLYVANTFGCADTSSQTVQVFPEPLSGFTLTPGSGCGPLAVNFSAALGAISYTWNYGDGSPVSNATNPPHTFTNVSTSDLTYSITLGITNAFGCSVTTSGAATVFAKPIANFIHTPNAGCAPLAVTFTNTSTLNSSNSWQFGNGQTSGGIDPAMTYTNGPGLGSQLYSVKLIVATVKGCKDSLSKQVTVLAQPKSAFALDTPACSPKILHFANNSIDDNSSLWNFGDATSSTQRSPQKLYTNASQFNVTYNVSLTSTSNDGCIHTFSVPVTIHPKPNFFIVSNPDSGCSPLKINFSKVVGAVKYTWDFYKDPANPKVVTTTSVSNTFINKTGFDQSYEVEMVAEDLNGCKDTANKTIKVFPVPTALFRADPLKVFIPEQPTNFINLSSLATKYAWNFGDGAVSDEKQPSHTYTGAGEYVITLTVTTAKGCVDSYRLPETVVALDETNVVFPNAFSPNAGGSRGSFYDPLATDNDVFHPQIRGAEKYLFSVYSRWGELLFETKNSAEGWDGYYKGKLCTQDVYIWKVSATFVDGKTYNKTGDVLLLR